MPIIASHHHLWDRRCHGDLVDEFLADVRTGHHVVATIFGECNSMYRADGPVELRSVGEAQGAVGMVAAASAEEKLAWFSGTAPCEYRLA